MSDIHSKYQSSARVELIHFWASNDIIFLIKLLEVEPHQSIIKRKRKI